MKFLPHQGVDDLRFGDHIREAISIFGQPFEKRSHSDEEVRTTLYFGNQLTLGFDISEKLVFISTSEERIELWDGRPFEVVKNAADPLVALSDWTESRGHRVTSHQDSFGATLEAKDAGVTFCISDNPQTFLEGIQLTPPKPKTA